MLSFSGAYLIGICFLHLLPELFMHDFEQTGLFLLIGFFLQLVLDYFSGGIEHGHLHLQKQTGKFPFLIFLSLSMHAFLETFPLIEINQKQGVSSFFLGLIIHKAPIAFILTFFLFKQGVKKKLIILTLILFSLFGPLGALLGNLLDAMSIYFQPFFALSIGIILHLATTILIENNEQHQIQWKKVTPLFLGVLLALSSLLFH